MAQRIVAGSDFKVWVEKSADTWVLIGCAEDVSLETNAETINASCKASGKWSESAPGQLSWGLNVSGIYKIYTAGDITGNYSATELWNALVNGTKLKVKVGTEEVGDPIWTGDVFATGWSLAGGTGDGATYDATFIGTGELVQDVVEEA